MSKFLNSKLLQLIPYAPGEQPQQQEYIKLNTNELPFPPSPQVLAVVQKQLELLNRYPDPSSARLHKALARHFCVEEKNIFTGNGSDEILAFAFQALCPNGAAFADITYGFYPVYCQLYGIEQQLVPLEEDFGVRVESYAGIDKTVILANPNAPTGLALAQRQVEELLCQNEDRLVVVDEAYVDFGAETSVPLVKKYGNLLVVGTFSKSRALAGGRLGYAVAGEELIDDLNRIKYSFNPYNLNRMTQAAAIAAVEDEEYFEETRREIVAVREDTRQKLQNLGFECADSLTNFLFVRHKTYTAEDLYTELKQRGVLVRWFDKPRIANYLRITVGTRQEMNRLIEKIQDIL